MERRPREPGSRPRLTSHAGRERALLGAIGDVAGTLESPRADAEAKAKVFAIDAARMLHDDKCTDVMILDLRGRSQITDYLVIASGTSDRQMKSAGEDVMKLGESQGMVTMRHNMNEPRATWRVIDMVDAIVHIFEPNTRLYYDLEMMWGDSPEVAWARSGETPHGAASIESDGKPD